VVPVGGDDGGRAVPLHHKPLVGRPGEGRRESVLCQHSHQRRRHAVLRGVVELRGLPVVVVVNKRCLTNEALALTS